MKKVMKGSDCSSKGGSTNGIAGIRKGNKGKGGMDARIGRADGGLCSSDWMASQGKGSKSK